MGQAIALLLIAVTLGAFGQIFMKKGMATVSGSGLVVLGKAMLTPQVLLGLCFYVFSTMFWLFVIKRLPLSLCYPMIAIGYVIVTILSIPMLNEKVPIGRWISLSVVCLGVILLATLGAGDESRQAGSQGARTVDSTSQHASASHTPPDAGTSL